jgi:hypothetical protein
MNMYCEGRNKKKLLMGFFLWASCLIYAGKKESVNAKEKWTYRELVDVHE